MAECHSDFRQGTGNAINVGTSTGVGDTAAIGAIAPAMTGHVPFVAITIMAIGGFATDVTRLAQSHGLSHWSE